MKKALIVVLVVLVVVTGVPIMLGGSGMASCQDCGPAVLFSQGCALAVLAVGVALFVALWRRRLGRFEHPLHGRLHGFALERPPQLA